METGGITEEFVAVEAPAREPAGDDHPTEPADEQVTVTDNAPTMPADCPQQNPRQDAPWLAREPTKIICFGDLSATSMEKMSHLFVI